MLQCLMELVDPPKYVFYFDKRENLTNTGPTKKLSIGMIFVKQKTPLVLIKHNTQTFLSQATLNEAGPLIIFCK
jgi:hypothetical protein